MRDLRVVVACIAALTAFGGCQSASTSFVAPSSSPSSNCTDRANSAGKLTICVRVPADQTVSSLVVEVSLYGKPLGDGGRQQFEPSTCPTSLGDRICAATFPAFSAARAVLVDQIGVRAAYASGKVVTGTFPAFVGANGASETAVLGGAIESVSAVPFLATEPPANGRSDSFLPLGQTERVWVVARDSQGSVIIGRYKPAVALSTSSNVVLSPKSPALLTDSADAAALEIAWAGGFLGTSTGSLTARTPRGPRGVATLNPGSGVVVFRAGPDTAGVGAGPVATRPDGTVYFVVNDKHCRTPGNCRTEVGRFDPATQRIDYVALRDVPGISQLYVSRDRALWMATFQPEGSWNAALPVLRMPPQQFSAQALQSLPASFGEASGFAEDDSGNLWISGCSGIHCSPDHNGSAIVVETTVSGPHTSPKVTIALTPACARFGYLGFSVGDVAFYRGNLYVIGLNDGSAPPARGTIWQVSAGRHEVSCRPRVPGDFNPSLYFAKVNGLLVFGVGGNSFDARWDISNGFYAVEGTGSKAILLPRYKIPLGTATHISASPDGGVLYYIANGVRDIRVFGLATYVPQENESELSGPWNVFPSGSFSGTQLDNGVSAVADGAWYTSDRACGKWQGICLARAIYLHWSAIPQQTLPSILVGSTTTFGIFSNPSPEPSEVPLNVHSGPFKIGARQQQTPGKAICNVSETKPEQSLTFVVKGLNAGTCLITISDSRQGGGSQDLVTVVK